MESWYSAHGPLEEVTERDLVKFFSLAAKYSAVPTLSQMQYAGKFVQEGYQNNHLIVVLTETDLIRLGILHSLGTYGPTCLHDSYIHDPIGVCVLVHGFHIFGIHLLVC